MSFGGFFKLSAPVENSPDRKSFDSPQASQSKRNDNQPEDKQRLEN